MWNAFGEVLPQAVAIAISPIPIVLVILMLVSDRARINGPSFGLGWTAGVMALSLAAFAIADRAEVSSDPDAADGGSVVQVLLGLVFVVLAVRQWRRRPRPGVEPPQPSLFTAVDSMSAIRAMTLGLTGAVANPKNLPLTLSAGVGIAQAGAAGASGFGAALLFSLTASLTVLALVALVLVLGPRTRDPLDTAKGWLMANNSTIMIVLFTILAATMLGSGLALTGP